MQMTIKHRHYSFWDPPIHGDGVPALCSPLGDVITAAALIGATPDKHIAAMVDDEMDAQAWMLLGRCILDEEADLVECPIYDEAQTRTLFDGTSTIRYLLRLSHDNDNLECKRCHKNIKQHPLT